MRRVTSIVFTACLMAGATVAVASPAVAASSVPRVTRISSAVGPLAARPLTLSGRNLSGVSKVRFGKTLASQLRHRGAGTLTLRAPASRRAATVVVYAYSARKWRSVSRYTYLGRPVITRSTPASGPVTGGQTTLVGSGLAYASLVRLGGTPVRVLARSERSVRVAIPAGVLGARTITVTTPGGTSAVGRGTSYTYALPAAANSASYDPAPSTVIAAGVQWVSRPAADGASAQTDNSAPWVVSVTPDGTLPTVGDGYFLRPGEAVYPAGFAGTVTSIASQQDGTFRISVAPTSLDETLTGAAIDYAPARATTTPQGRRVASGSAEQAGFTGLRSGVFECRHGEDGELATFTGEIGLRFDELSPVFKYDGGLSQSFDAYVTGKVTAYGKIAVDASMTCTLKKSWANAHKKIIPIGTTGATVSIAPAAKLTITGNATVSVEQSTRFTYGVRRQGGGGASFYQVADQEAARSNANANVQVDATLGLAIQIGWLDRIGVDVQPALFVDGAISYTSSPSRACAKINFGLQVGITGFLDLFLARWETGTASKRFTFATLDRCSSPDTAALASGDPQITSDTLADATQGTDYAGTLETADNRNGSWSISGGSLPSGLSLSGNQIEGTPTSVGTYRPTITFVDALGRVTSSVVLLRVLPSRGLGGGDIQATLTWNSSADLDLHATEPSGTEVDYREPGPTSSGGQLDHDANAGCGEVDPAPAENVFWPSSSAESGRYEFWVHTFDTCGADDLTWHLVVRVQGRVVVDQTGSGGSDMYSIAYGTNGAARVMASRPVRATSDHAPK